MAKDKKVTEITDMEVDFAQWFTDVCTKAQLIDYSSIKGVFIYRPYGYAIWENIQHIMDKEFKKQRHIDILDTLLFELLVHDILNIFPDGVAIGTVDEHALDGGIVDQLCLLAHVGEPLGKVHLHIGDLFYLLIFSHSKLPLFALVTMHDFVLYIIAHLSSVWGLFS